MTPFTDRMVEEFPERLKTFSEPIPLSSFVEVLYEPHEYSTMAEEQRERYCGSSVVMVVLGISELEQVVLNGLIDGSIIGTGIIEPVSVNLTYKKIMASTWKKLQVRFLSGEAIFGGLKITDIHIEAAKADDSASVGRKIPKAEIKKWYKDYALALSEAGKRTNQTDDELAAEEAFGQSVPRDSLKSCRREHPEIHKPRGRPKKVD